MKKLSRQNIMAMMKKFAENRGPGWVYFDSLDSEDQMIFAMLKTFQYFKFLPLGNRLDRTAENITAQAKNGFIAFSGDKILLTK